MPRIVRCVNIESIYMKISKWQHSAVGRDNVCGFAVMLLFSSLLKIPVVVSQNTKICPTVSPKFFFSLPMLMKPLKSDPDLSPKLVK